MLSTNIVGEQTSGKTEIETQTNEMNFLVTLYNTFLLKRGQDVDDFSEDLRAKLEYEILSMEFLGIIKDMIKRGINFDTEDRIGNTSLHYITKEKPVDYIETLIDLKLDFSVKNCHGSNCTFTALRHGKKDVFELLCRKGFKPRAQLREIFLFYKT